MIRILSASLIAAVALFFWGFVFWTVIEPTVGVIQTAPDESTLAADIARGLQEEGTYFLPTDTSDMDAWQRRHEAGPLVTVMFKPEGAKAMDPAVMVRGFVHMLVSILLAAFLLRWIARYLGSYKQRLGFMVWLGLIEAIFSNLGRPIWYFQPWDYHLLQAAYTLTSWTLVGAILAWFLHGDT